MTIALPARRKRAFITGITAQDGSDLAELLISKNYEFHGIKRRSSGFNTERVDHLISDWHECDVSFFLHSSDLSDASSLSKPLNRIAPDEICRLGAPRAERRTGRNRRVVLLHARPKNRTAGKGGIGARRLSRPGEYP